MKHLEGIFTLNGTVSKSTMKLIVGVQLLLLCLCWVFSSAVFLPKPSAVYAALSLLWTRGVGYDMFVSFRLNIEAILWSTGISLTLAYLTVVPFFRPVVEFLGKLRFLSMVGLSFVFTLMTSSSHDLKLSMLVFSISVFFVTSMADVLASIPKHEYDLARTLKMKEWEVVWEVVILGQIDKVFDVIRQNAAIGWLMLTMVEGMSRSEGGIGALLLNQNKYFKLEAVMAIQLMIFIVGIGQDLFIGFLKKQCCPYATLTTEKK